MGFKLSRGREFTKIRGGGELDSKRQVLKSFSYFLPGQIYLFFPKINRTLKTFLSSMQAYLTYMGKISK